MKNVSQNKMKELTAKGYSLDIIWVLLQVESGEVLSNLSLISPKIDNLCATVLRKGLVSTDKLTLEGEELIKFFTSKDDIKLVKKRPKDENFTLWWSQFPSLDSFTYKGKKFEGSRSLKAKKEECKEKLNSILSEGEYTIEEMIEALNYEITQKKENSIKTGQNKMSYFQNSMTYLNQKGWESYIEAIRAGNKVKESSTQTNDTFI